MVNIQVRLTSFVTSHVFVSEMQFVIFKPLSYCFEETIGFDVKASFESRLVSRLSWWYNKPGDITKDFWGEAIQFHGTFHRLKITNRIACKKNWVLPDLNVKVCCNNDQKNSKHCNKKNKQFLLDFLGFWITWLYWTKYFIMLFCDSVILLSVLLFSDGLNLLKEVDVWVIFVLFVFERFTLHLSGVFKLTTRLELTDPERMSTISMSRKLDMSFKGNTVNRKVFLFLSAPLKLGYQQECYFPDITISNSKET